MGIRRSRFKSLRHKNLKHPMQRCTVILRTGKLVPIDALPSGAVTTGEVACTAAGGWWLGVVEGRGSLRGKT
jgi:hypothetical protein